MSQPHIHDYLNPRTLAAIGSIELRARMIVEGRMTGMHRSPMEGISVEFAQHRQYTPGDDTRFLDWKVYGKTDKLYLKQHQKETNLDLIILVDASGSMQYASTNKPVVADSPNDRHGAKWRKYDHAASLAAAMCYIALRQQDRVSVVLFADDIKTATRLSNTHSHWRAVLEVLGSAAIYNKTSGEPLPQERTNLGRVFNQAVARLTRRSLVVLISDLFDDIQAIERGLARLKFSRHDVIVMQILDPAELNFLFRGPSRFWGLEAEGHVNLDPQTLRQAYLDSLQQHLDKIERLARRFQFDYGLIDTSQSLGPALSRFMAKRNAATKWRS